MAPPIPPSEEAVTAASDTDGPDTHEVAAPEEAVDEPAEEPVLLEEEKPNAWYYAPVYWFDLWEGNVELGMSGSHGNSETLNYLVGLDAKRETDTHVLDFDLKYDRKSANSIETAHRLFGEIRWELLFEDTCWTWFFHETTEYDEFTAYDLRLSYDTGLGRCLIKNDDTSLLARAGAGFSHEIGSPNDELVPEAVFGMELDHKLNERQKVSASSEYSPDVTDFMDYRLNSKASWEVLLDEETNLSLKVSILDRYDSTPHGKKANDLDYTLTLLWSF
jgi:putative salt-induced outer membrane protein YdiY